MEKKPVNREWVKSAAIVFLTVLLVLTFFSKTISNRLLTEVATSSVQTGTITAKVRGSGTVAANGSHEVKATQTREVGTVLIKVGQQVSVGDPLFTLGAGDSDELEAAYETLRSLQQSYRNTAAGMPQYNYDREQYSLTVAEEEAERASEAESEARTKYENAVNSSAAKAARIRKEETEKKIQEMDELYYALADYFYIRDDLNAEIQKEKSWLEAGLAGGAIGYMTTNDNDRLPQEEVDAANARIAQDNASLSSARAGLAVMGISEPTEEKMAEVSNSIDSLKRDLEMYAEEYSRIVDGAAYEYQNASDVASQARTAAENARLTLEASIASGQQQIDMAYIQLEGISQQIAAQQEKIKKLTGEDGESITSNVSGTVQSIFATSGDRVAKGDVMCVIEVPDMGHTVSFSVTNDQAKRLRIGDSAKVSNFYWGNEVIATLTTVVNDPKSPQTSKLLTFELTGDVNTGDQITVSVGSKSAVYDVVVPNSAIRSDSNGSFVLYVEAKNSPIGNRYIAKRVNVEIVASDDENSAVTGALTNGDFVITTTSAPVKSGDQVRLADSNE